MLYKKTKDEALRIHNRACEKYNKTVEKVNFACNDLFNSRTSSKACITKIEALINSITNTPKEFKTTLSKVNTAVDKFKKTEEYAKQSLKDLKRVSIKTIAGVAIGTAVASYTPMPVLMWILSTFGYDAALSFLAFSGPIGWGIAGASTTISASVLSIKNQKMADKAIEEAKRITIAGAELNETLAIAENLNKETTLLLQTLSKQYVNLLKFADIDYSSISDDDQIALGTMVNNTLALAELLNKTVGGNDAN